MIFKEILNQSSEKKHIIMSEEIKEKQKIINRLIKEKFGNNFIPIKLDSLTKFESNLKKFFFSPRSIFLNKFPKLKRELIKERKIKEKKLNEKINIGSLLYLSTNGIGAYNSKNINDKFFKLSKNLSSTTSKNILTNVLYKVKFEEKNKRRLNKILSHRELRNKHFQELQKQENQDNIGFVIPEINIPNNNIKAYKPLNKYMSRNFSSNQYPINSTTNSPNKNYTENNSFKSFSPFSTYNTINQNSSRKYFYKTSKTLKKNLTENMENLDDHTKLCNKKLIRIMNCNRKFNLKKKHKEIYNLKNFLVEEKKRKRPKKKINNILQIKSLINKAKLDNEGEIAKEKIRKKQLKNFGHYINIMSDDLVLSKIKELYSEEELKQKAKNFSQEEFERIKKKEQKDLIQTYSMKKVKDNNNIIKKLEYDLSNIKIKFYETDFKTLQK